MESKDTGKGAELVRLYEKLESTRAPWENEWRTLAEYIQPGKANLYSMRHGSHSDTPSFGFDAKLYDPTGLRSNQVLARGQLAWMTPKEVPWFAFTSPNEADGDNEAVNDWLDRVTKITQLALAASNFYTEIHECYLDRGGFGTTALHTDYEPKDRRLLFECWPINTYVCSEDARNRVDTVGRKRRLTAKQAAELFGEDNLPKEVKKKVGDAQHSSDTEDYVWLIYPRKAYRMKSPLASDMPYASCWIHQQTRTIVQEGGYLELPVHVSRFERWTGVSAGNAPYGRSPAWAALGDMRQLNHLEKMMDALADRKVEPPILMHERFSGKIDIRPKGVTLFSEDVGDPRMAALPWMHEGEYNVGQIRAEEKRERIQKLFMVDLFEMMASISNQMTATEVNARLQEKVDQFSPTFDLITSELLEPCIQRVFSLLLRYGHYPEDIPQELIVQNQETGQLELELPGVEYSSKIALAISQSRDQGAIQTLQMAGEIAPAYPEIFDNVDIDSVFRDTWRNSGADPSHLKDKDQVDQERHAKREAMMQMQQEQAAMEEAAA